jgi:low molecular weight phosphotyrosine protein phosphatase
MFGEFGGQDSREPIVDPWYDGGRKGFEVAYEQVTRMGKGLLQHIEAEAKKEKSEL